VLCASHVYSITVYACMQVKDQLVTFEFGDEPLFGIATISTPWHSPGHVAYVIPDGDAKLVYGGDWVAHKVLSIENPWLEFAPDMAYKLGPPGRYELLDRAVKERWQLLNAHVAFPGLMYVDHQGGNFEAIPPPYVGSGDVMSVCT
jgi:glyoxylase-like metal-dependent hydrolase (beta-lactamase superfamily II)